jgi:ketosteroid isomerase-like protein
MSEENVEQVRARYEQFARGDFTPMEEAPDDFEFVASTNVPDAGTYRGEAARRWMKAWVESFDGLTMEATEIIDVGDKVFCRLRPTGPPPGRPNRCGESLVVRRYVSRGRARPN